TSARVGSDRSRRRRKSNGSTRGSAASARALRSGSTSASSGETAGASDGCSASAYTPRPLSAREAAPLSAYAPSGLLGVAPTHGVRRGRGGDARRDPADAAAVGAAHLLAERRKLVLVPALDAADLLWIALHRTQHARRSRAPRG